LQKRAESRNANKGKGKKFPTYKAGKQVLVRENRPSSAPDKKNIQILLILSWTITQEKKIKTIFISDEQGKHYTHNMKNLKLYFPLNL